MLNQGTISQPLFSTSHPWHAPCTMLNDIVEYLQHSTSVQSVVLTHPPENLAENSSNVRSFSYIIILLDLINICCSIGGFTFVPFTTWPYNKPPAPISSMSIFGIAVLSHTRILPIRVWAAHTRMGKLLDPYAYGLPVRVRAAHTSIAGNPCFAHMRISAHTCMAWAYSQPCMPMHTLMHVAIGKIGRVCGFILAPCMRCMRL